MPYLSSIPGTHYGNDTIDRYPLPYEGELTKLLCISTERFKKLQAVLDEFGLRQKSTSPKPKTPLRQKLSEKDLPASPKNNDLELDRDKCTGSFEPSNIIYTRNSFFWRLRNLNAWFKEQESYEDSRYIKAYKIEI